MPKKAKKFVALFRTQWTSAKSTVPPAALRRVDFSKGLGPVLDTLEKKWDAAADLDPVPPKMLADLQAQVVKFQKTTKDYQAQIIKANKDDPANGPGWFALHEALRKIDEGVVQDMQELGVTCTWLKGWVAKSDFDRTAGKLGPSDGAPADSTEYRKQGFAALAARVGKAPANDPVAFGKALDDGLRTCLPHSRDLVKTLGQFTGAYVTTARDYVRHMSAKPPDKRQAAASADRAKQIEKALLAAMPVEGKAVGDKVAVMTKKMERAAAAVNA